ncbi:hypothetical protein VE03_05240 [Pseudogymnoascus sp. 23342-1-I1]|nr:hypothetical protein VE03_05240 [Pseudogymnoascus sp. 23342-1-I1]
MASDNRQRRIALSCEGCRQRKAKCTKPRSGPCHRCIRLGKECLLGAPAAPPYYHTSKERYDLMVSVIHHFVPSADVSTEGLRQFVKNLLPPMEGSLSSTAHTEASKTVPWLPDSSGKDVSPMALPTPENSPSCVVDDVEDTLLADAMNIPRFNGSSSWIALNAKIVCHLSTNNNSLSPFNQGYSSRNAEYLPDRAALERAAVLFFRDINSVIFILDQEKFYVWLDDVYGEQDVSTSILVIVYLVMALCGDEASSFEIARSYINDVIEESSLNSVRAIMLMTLYRQTRDECSLGWVILGTGIRIAQSFGLHQMIGYTQDTSVYRAEVKRRIWWSLCELDQWTSCMLGRPPAIGYTEGGVPLPSPELNTTAFTPPGYATASAALGCLIGQISEQMYTDKKNAHSEEKLSSDLVQRVEQWRRELPRHLNLESTIAPSFVRTTSYLGLKYNYACMLIGRPYLTHSVLCNNTHGAVFSSQLEICERANSDSVNILHNLYTQGLLVSSLYFDTYLILTTALILYIRSVKKPSLREDLRSFIPILKMCSRSKVGQYAADHVQRYLGNLQTTTVESNTANMADFFQQASTISQDRLSAIGDSDDPSRQEININELGDDFELPLEYFEFGQEFNIRFCGVNGAMD